MEDAKLEAVMHDLRELLEGDRLPMHEDEFQKSVLTGLLHLLARVSHSNGGMSARISRLERMIAPDTGGVPACGERSPSRI